MILSELRQVLLTPSRVGQVEELVDHIIEHLSTDRSAILTTPWLWPIGGLLLPGGAVTDERGNWEGKRPHPIWVDAVLAALLGSAE